MPPTHPRFKLVVDCGCGRRYFRHRIEEATDRDTRSLCICGVELGAASGAFSFCFESDKAHRLRQSLAVRLSPHC